MPHLQPTFTLNRVMCTPVENILTHTLERKEGTSKETINARKSSIHVSLVPKDKSLNITDMDLEDLNVIFVNAAVQQKDDKTTSFTPILPVKVRNNLIFYITKLPISYVTIWSNQKQIARLKQRGYVLPNTIELIENTLANYSIERDLHYRIKDIEELFSDPKYRLADPDSDHLLKFTMGLTLEQQNTLSGFCKYRTLLNH